MLVQLEELHQHGKEGLLVDHLKQEFWTIDSEIDANAIPPGSPQVAVYMVQSRQGRVVRDLGRKRLDGKMARGLGFVLDNTRPKSELGPVSFLEDDEWKWKDVEFEVWVNEKTNLPIEFRAVRKTPHAEISYRFHNLIWNETQRFELEAPAGYQELEKTDE